MSVCNSFDESKAKDALSAAVTHAISPCPDPNEQSLKTVRQLDANLTAVTTRLTGTAEDGFFASLGQQHAVELNCSAGFAARIGAGNDTEIEDDLIVKVQLLREYKQELIAATARLTKNPNILRKTCPLSLSDLDSEFSPAVREHDPSYHACHEVIAARTAYQSVLGSIPVSRVPSVYSLLDRYATGKDGKTSAELLPLLRSAYQDAQKVLSQQSASLSNKVKTQGGMAFNRSERRALLSDPRITEKVIERSGKSNDVRALACQIDARYGSGADTLDATLMVGSLLIGGEAVAAGKLVTRGVAEVAQGAKTARSLGMFSLNSSRILQISALGINGISAYEMIDQACPSKPISLKVNASDAAGTCSDSPSAESIHQDSCVLAWTLSTLAVGTPLLSSQKIPQLLARLKRMNGESLEHGTVAGSSAARETLMEKAGSPSDDIYKPINHPKTVKYSDLKMQTETQVQEMKTFGIGFRRMQVSTYLRRKFVTSDEIEFIGNEKDSGYFGRMFEVTRLPKAGTATGPDVIAWTHPEMAGVLKNLDEMDWKVVVDTSLRESGAGAYVRPDAKIIGVPPNVTWKTLSHELQHVEYNTYIRPILHSLKAQAARGKSIFEILNPYEINLLGKERLKKIDLLLKKGIPDLGINETLSVDRELKLLGFRRYLPGEGMSDLKYALRHQITELTKITEKGEKLTPIQEKTLSRLKLQYTAILQYESKAPVVANAAVKAATTGIKSAKPLVLPGVGALLVDHPEIGFNSYAQIVYDLAGHVFAQTYDGLWVYLKKE